MAGLYLHIPFCRQACHYCNFHFSTSLEHKEAMIGALLLELDLQKDYLADKELGSVYFGGGTPSLLETGELLRIFEKIQAHFSIAPDAEITLEANPDDLTAEKLGEWRQYTPLNRLSIGIQSFREADLRWMNRAHTAQQAAGCLDLAVAAGFADLSVDLIYGLPGATDADWAQNLEKVFERRIPHLSCYCLTVEPGTALGTFVRKGREKPVDEEAASRQFEYLVDLAADKGYEHYEISNFALPGRHARHNSSYWFGAPYLGIGPSAHSYDGKSRQWNIANNALYIKAIEAGQVPFEQELLTSGQQYNEYVMTALRTMWGADEQKIREMGAPMAGHFLRAVEPYLKNGTVVYASGHYRLSKAGKLLADGIAADLFWVD
ncbi:MAG: radical SAM family heme chaperone HemW [Lewinellaceae bacterium]|nr:radical SAM family heme chaperone HemW [Lewinellaceae bacterium]